MSLRYRQYESLQEASLKRELKFAASFDDPKVDAEMKKLAKYVPKIVAWLNKHTKIRGTWKANPVGPVSTIHYPNTYAAGVKISAREPDRSWWVINLYSPVGMNEIGFSIERPWDRRPHYYFKEGLKKKDLGRPEEMFGWKTLPLK